MAEKIKAPFRSTKALAAAPWLVGSLAGIIVLVGGPIGFARDGHVYINFHAVVAGVGFGLAVLVAIASLLQAVVYGLARGWSRPIVVLAVLSLCFLAAAVVVVGLLS